MQIPSNLPVFTASRRNGPGFKAAANTQAPASPLFAAGDSEKKLRAKLLPFVFAPLLTLVGCATSPFVKAPEDTRTNHPWQNSLENPFGLSDKEILDLESDLQILSILMSRSFQTLLEEKGTLRSIQREKPVSLPGGEERNGVTFKKGEHSYTLRQFQKAGAATEQSLQLKDGTLLSLEEGDSSSVSLIVPDPKSALIKIDRYSSENEEMVNHVKAFFQELKNVLAYQHI